MSRRKPYVDTEVPARQSQNEMYELVEKFGGQAIRIGEVQSSDVTLGEFMIGFSLDDRDVRITCPVPARIQSDDEWKKDAQRRWDQERRTAARSLFYFVKAKLNGIEMEIESVDFALGLYMVLPSGRTVAEEHGDRFIQQLREGAVLMIPETAGPEAHGVDVWRRE